MHGSSKRNPSLARSWITFDNLDVKAVISIDRRLMSNCSCIVAISVNEAADDALLGLLESCKGPSCNLPLLCHCGFMVETLVFLLELHLASSPDVALFDVGSDGCLCVRSLGPSSRSSPGGSLRVWVVDESLLLRAC